jgi:hypothetical protein
MPHIVKRTTLGWPVLVASGYVRALESLLGEHGVLGVAAR